MPNDARSPGRPLRVDPDATSADPDLPAFLAPLPGAPAYAGFPVLADVESDGFVLGVISDWEAEPIKFGDAFVVAPDGTRAGLVWDVGDERQASMVVAPDDRRWGVWAVSFPHGMRTRDDARRNLDSIVGQLRPLWEAHRSERADLEPSRPVQADQDRRVVVLAYLAQRIRGLELGHPVRVAVDGITASGKTTFAEALADELRRAGDRSVVRVSMDGFHHPRAVRHRQGRGSADGYYEDAYDVASVRSVLLDPLGPGGHRAYRTAVIDLAADTPVDDPPAVADPSAILLVDGSFLQKPALRDAWDLVVYLRASFDAAARRGVARDAAALGGTEAAEAAFRDRYHAAQHRYLAECQPEQAADVVIDNDDPADPHLIRS